MVLVAAALSIEVAASGQRPARAAEPPGDAAAKAEAQAHLDQGNALFTTDRYQDALVEFQAAYALYPSPKLHFNLGQCQRALGHAAAALEHFQRFLDEAQDVPPGLREEAQHYVEELRGAAPPPINSPAAPPPAAPPPAAPPSAPLPPGVTPYGVAPPPPQLVQSATAEPAAAPVGRPLYRRWWFWAAVGAVAVAGAVAGVVLLSPHDPPCPATVMGCY